MQKLFNPFSQRFRGKVAHGPQKKSLFRVVHYIRVKLGLWLG